MKLFEELAAKCTCAEYDTIQLDFINDAVVQHTLAAQPDVVIKAIVHRGFSPTADNPIAAFIIEARKEFASWAWIPGGHQGNR